MTRFITSLFIFSWRLVCNVYLEKLWRTIGELYRLVNDANALLSQNNPQLADRLVTYLVGTQAPRHIVNVKTTWYQVLKISVAEPEIFFWFQFRL
jgi:hypothetical protein